MAHTLDKELKYSQPGIYHIQIIGSVPPELWDYFEGETDLVSTDKNGNITTSLKMHVRDQAELAGLINMLYEWRLILLSVKWIDFSTAQKNNQSKS